VTARLVVTAGLPGSGTTTVGRAVAERLGATNVGDPAAPVDRVLAALR
jgi:cytidylate kinase